MGKIVWYIFILILVYLLIVYYKGTYSVVGQIGSNVRNLVLDLQGRSANGAITNYPGNN